MKIKKIAPQIAALYLGQKCARISNGWEFTLEGVCGGGAFSVDGWVCSLSDITLHLRRLESLTEQEARELYFTYYQFEFNGPDAKGWWGSQVETPSSSIMAFHIGSPAAWLYLLSRGFDLFNLIDAGLAKEVTP